MVFQGCGPGDRFEALLLCLVLLVAERIALRSWHLRLWRETAKLSTFGRYLNYIMELPNLYDL